LGAAGVDVAEALAGLQHGSAAGEDDIFGERRTILQAGAEVFADGVANGRLEEDVFERFGAHEAQKIKVGEAFEFGGDVEIGAGIGEKNSGIDEVGLAFVFAGTHVGQETAVGGEGHSGTGETDGFAIPEAEEAAGEIGEIVDGIEAAGAAIARIGVAGRIEGRDAEADPVFVEREFGGGHLRVDGDAAASDGIEGVFAEGLIEGVCEIEAFDVTAAEPAEIADADAVRDGAEALVDDVAERSRTDEEAVVVVMHAGIVFVEGANEFGGVAREKEILDIQVAQDNLLVAASKAVEAAVGIFFEQIEVGGVVFETIAAQIAEDAHGRLFVDEKKAAEVGVEFLDAGANGNEIVIGAEIVEFYFGEGFLQADVGIETGGAFADIGTDDAEFADVEIVEADFGSDADAPVHGLEGGVAVEKIEEEAEGLVQEELFAVTEECGAAGVGGADAAGRGNPAAVEESFGGAGEIQKDLRAEERGPDGLVAFEAIAIERIVPARLGVEVFAAGGIAAVVGLLQGPAIGDGVEDVGNGRENVGSEFDDIVGIGIETVAKFAVRA